METTLAVFALITANLPTLVTIAFAGIGVLSQAAAIFNLGWLANVSTGLHDGVQFLAGNWGKAVNVVKLVEKYRSAGPAAALSELAALATPAQAKDDGGSSFPPGAAGAGLVLAVMLGVGSLAACLPISNRVDQITGTSLAERCKVYQAGDIAADALAAAFPELEGFAAVDDAAVKVLCTQPVGALQVPK